MIGVAYRLCQNCRPDLPGDDRRFGLLPGARPPALVVQLQLVQRAAAIPEAGRAAIAAVVGHTDETVIVIEHHAEIGGRAVCVAASY